MLQVAVSCGERNQGAASSSCHLSLLSPSLFEGVMQSIKVAMAFGGGRGAGGGQWYSYGAGGTGMGDGGKEALSGKS